MKLTDYKNEDALDLLADILDPFSEILADKEIIKMFQDKNATRIKAVQYLLKEHKKPILQIMARLDGVPVEQYEINLLDIPKKLLEILNDKELIDFFRSQGQTMAGGSFGSVTENTTETGET